MLLSLLALCAAPTPPQSAFTPPATQQALPATQPALSASLAAAEAQDGDQTIADTDTDTDRVPSHTSGRDRRDDQHCLVRGHLYLYLYLYLSHAVNTPKSLPRGPYHTTGCACLAGGPHVVMG